jgi:hypothetical protein
MALPIILSQTNETSNNQTEEISSTGNGKGQFVNTLALIIILLSAIMLIILIAMTWSHLTTGDTSFENIKNLLGILLPVIGTWMGTILAFYFSKQNFEAANQRVKEMVNQITTTDEKLQVFKVADVMFKPDTSFLTLTNDEADFKAQKLSDLLTKMKESHSERMPVLQKNTLIFIFLIYRTTVERFVLGYNDDSIKLIPERLPKPPGEDLTVGDMFQSDYKEIKDILNTKNCFQPLTATLNEIKQAMQGNSMCQDVFITKTGSKEEPVEGWVTNDLIIEKAELFKKTGVKS